MPLEVCALAWRSTGKKAEEKVARVMREKKRGTLKSGRSGKRVTSRKQAIAIGVSEPRRHAVFIATPNSEHAEHCVRAANAGVHVLCEKPLAVTDAECERITRACRDAGVKLMTAYRLHFDPLVLDVLKQIRAGRIGTLRYLTASFSMQAKPDGIRTTPETGGGTLYDLGVYCINAARMVFDAEPVQVFAYSIDGASAKMPGVDQTTAAVLRYDDERVASFVTGFSSADVSSLRIVGSSGDILMEPAFEYAEPLKYTLTAGETTVKKRGREARSICRRTPVLLRLHP